MTRYLKMLAVIVFLINVRLAIAEEKELLNSADCLDRFLVNAHHAEVHTAVLGKASLVGTRGPNLTHEIDFFQANGETAGSEKRRYSEARSIYAFGANSDLWERRFEAGEELFRSVGSYSQKLRKVEPVKYDEKSGETTGATPHMRVPVVHSMTVTTCSSIGRRDGLPNTEHYINSLRVLEESKTEHGVSGFFYDRRYGVKMDFDRRKGWCPTQVTAYFREGAEDANQPTKEQFKKVWFEISSDWEPIAGSDIFVPVRIVNRVLRVNRNSDEGIELTLDATWRETRSIVRLFDQGEVDQAPVDGKISELRKLMQQELEKRVNTKKK